MALKKTKTKALPKSKARNAYALLDEVKALILAEPKRYRQDRWIVRKGNDNDSADVKTYPACGAVACVAGWVVALKTPKGFSWREVENKAADILGLDVFSASELFNGDAVLGRPQTAAYAKKGVAHIRRFQDGFKEQLKAKRV